LNQPCRTFNTNTKEESHGEEKEGQRKEEQAVTMKALASYWGCAVNDL
jgi:hypothetical protein